MKHKIIFIVNPISGHHNKTNFPDLVRNHIDKTNSTIPLFLQKELIMLLN